MDNEEEIGKMMMIKGSKYCVRRHLFCFSDDERKALSSSNSNSLIKNKSKTGGLVAPAAGSTLGHEPICFMRVLICVLMSEDKMSEWVSG